ncbi:MAG: DUF4154 domain-containing protein [Bacteroidales bacterium]|nr:DUF4154 domain-containing protein [Bacteroidales bacterium]
MLRRLLFIILILIMMPKLYSQTENQLKSVLINKFIEMIDWPNEQKIDTFRILLYTGDKVFIKELRNSLERRTRKGKNIAVYGRYEFTDFFRSNLVYIPLSEKTNVRIVHEQIKDKPILMVTENSPFQDLNMLNLIIAENKKIEFEINPTRLQKFGMLANPQLIVMGGSDLDVEKLYKDTQFELEQERKRLERRNDELKKLQSRLNKLQNDLLAQKEFIASQKQIVGKQYDMLQSQKDSMIVQQKVLDNLEVTINDYESKVDQTQKTLIDHQIQIIHKEEILYNQQKDINHYNSIIEEKQNEIQKQKRFLEDQNLVIETKNRIIYLFIIIIGLLVLVGFYMYRIYRIKKNTSTELALVNIQINKQKHELETTLNTLKLTQSQLVNSEKMASLGQLTAGIAHEINNPINYIASGIHSLQLDLKDIELLLDKYECINEDNYKNMINEIEELKVNIDYKIVKEELNTLIDSVNKGVKRTIEIVSGLRSFSRLDEDTLKKVNIAENLESTITLLEHRIKNKITIKKDFAQKLEIECYPGPLNQVFMNILSNAIDAIPNKGIIAISILQTDDNTVKICIKDNGDGIKKENLHKIFDPFFTTKDVGKGTGLGLSITFGIIQKHNGIIAVESEIGSGTEFIISLPIHQPNANIS